jgi:hypothetical protein
MHSDEPKKPETTFAEAVRELAGFSATMVGLLYVSGLFIVNFDLGRFGIGASDLASSQYVIVGSVWAVLLAGVGFPLILAVNLASYLFSEKRFALVFATWILSIGWCATLMTYFNVIDLRNLHHTGAFVPLEGMLVEIVVLGITVAARRGLGMSDLLFGPTPFARLNFDQRARLAVGFMFLSSGLLLLLAVYAASVFPAVPKGLGGGQKPVVRVLLTEADKADWKTLKIPTAQGGQEIGPVRLILEASDSIVVSRWDSLDHVSLFGHPSDYSPPVYISKKNISEIVYLGAD